jgi:hypothetical protein
LGSEEALQFDTFKALKYLLFLQLAGRGASSSSSTHETTFGFSKQLMGACATTLPWMGLVSDCTLFCFCQ